MLADRAANDGRREAGDAELALRIGRGDADAEAELCRRFAPRVRLYGLRHLRDEDGARDLVQSVLVIAIVALRAGRVEDPERVDRFILGTARNLALRAREDAARAEPRDHEALDVEFVPPSLDRVDMPVLLRCLEHLDARAKTVLHLSFYRDRTADEIAGVLDTTAGNVRIIRHRAVADLRRCFDGPKEHGA